MTEITSIDFGPSEGWGNIGEACTTIFVNGADGGCIEKFVEEVGSGLAFEYRASVYSVELDGRDTQDFHVCDYSSARKALAAAKAWVRAQLDREECK